SFEGPNTLIPATRRKSASPAASGSSGPITTRPIFSLTQKRARRSRSVGSMGTLPDPSAAVPAFPGAQKTRSTRRDCRSFHTKACSRPPLPITRTFMGLMYDARKLAMLSQRRHGPEADAEAVPAIDGDDGQRQADQFILAELLLRALEDIVRNVGFADERDGFGP